MGRHKDKDPTDEMLAEIKSSLSAEDIAGVLAIARAKAGVEVKPEESSTGGNGQFQEPVAKEQPQIIPEQAKINIANMLGHIDDNLDKTILTSEVPDHILIRSVVEKTREERRNSVYRALHPNETFKQTLMKNLYLHLTARSRKRVKELLNIAELETDKGHEGNMPFSLGQ